MSHFPALIAHAVFPTIKTHVVTIFKTLVLKKTIIANITFLDLVIVNPVKMLLPLHCTDCDDHAKCINGKCVCQEGYDGNGNVCEGIYKICSLRLYL